MVYSFILYNFIAGITNWYKLTAGFGRLFWVQVGLFLMPEIITNRFVDRYHYKFYVQNKNILDNILNDD